MANRGQITDSEIYSEDKNLLGIAEEFKSVDLETEFIEQEGLGSVGMLKLPARGLKELSGMIKIFHPEPDFYSRMLNPVLVTRFQIHEKVDVFGPEGFVAEKSTTLITTIDARFMMVEQGTNKKGDPRTTEAKWTASRLIQKFASRSVNSLEVDLFNNVHKVNDLDVWPN